MPATDANRENVVQQPFTNLSKISLQKSFRAPGFKKPHSYFSFSNFSVREIAFWKLTELKALRWGTGRNDIRDAKETGLNEERRKTRRKSFTISLVVVIIKLIHGWNDSEINIVVSRRKPKKPNKKLSYGFLKQRLRFSNSNKNGRRTTAATRHCWVLRPAESTQLGKILVRFDFFTNLAATDV